jgi:hypothetical protein
MVWSEGISSCCKKIRNDENLWQQLGGHVSEHPGAVFSYGICPDCFEKSVGRQLTKLQSPDGKP